MKNSSNASLRLLVADRLKAFVAKAEVGKKKPLPKSLWRFCCDCVRTFDENASAKGLSDPVQPWPRKKHLWWLAAILSTFTHVSVIKSGQIMVTWLVAAAVAHRVLTRKGYNVAWYCRTATQAEQHVERRVFRIIQMIPPEYDVPRVKVSNGVLMVFHDASDIPSSRIQPMAAERYGASQAASAARSETWSLTVRDEAAFDPNDREIHMSGKDRTAECWRVSTPNGANFHCRLMYEEGFGATAGYEAPPDDAKLCGREMWRWKRNGFQCVMILHRADPDRDENRTATGKAWYDRLRPLSDDRTWNREQRGWTSVPAGEPVYINIPLSVFVSQSYDPRLVLARGHDWGWNGMACLWAQLEDRGAGKYCLHFLREKLVQQQESLDLLRYGQEVLDETTMYFPESEVIDFGDVSGGQHSLQTGKTTFEVLEPMGIHVRAQRFFVPPTIALMQYMLRMGWIEIDPDGCPRLQVALQGGYSKDDWGEPIKDGVYDHIADAARYLVSNLFVRGEGANAGVDAVRTFKGYFRRGAGARTPDVPAAASRRGSFPVSARNLY